MTEGYHPPSDFLQACIAEEVPLTGSRFADANLARLIAMTRDADDANRDWAVLLLAQTGFDTEAIRAALIERVGDGHAIVRAEALVGLAERDAALALPMVAAALESDDASTPLFEAAQAVGDPALLPLLLPWRAERADPPDWIDDTLEAAIMACGGAPPD